MHLTNTLAIAATISCCFHTACSNPVPDTNLESLRRTNRVVEVAANTGPSSLNRHAHRAAIHARYNMPIPAGLAKAAAAPAPKQTGSVNAIPSFLEAAYYVPVQVGVAPNLKTYRLNFDTGSADAWLFSTLLPAAQRGNHTLYNTAAVPKKRIAGETFSAAYADGSSASGPMYRDVVNIGGVNVTMPVGTASQVAPRFQGQPMDGFIGLSFKSLSTASPNQQDGFMDYAISTMPQPLFTSTLRHGSPGEYDFGFIDTAKAATPIVYSDVDDWNGFWEFSSDTWSVGTGPKQPDFLNLIADTGSSIILTTESVVQGYWSKVPGSKYNSTVDWWTFPCANAAKLPSFSIWIGGAKRTVPGPYLNYGSDDGKSCFGSIQVGDGFYTILGDTFLKSQFVVWNYGLPGVQARIGFAQQKGVVV